MVATKSFILLSDEEAAVEHLAANDTVSDVH